MKEDFTEVVAILDMSGSMSSIANDTIGGFNAYVNELRINEDVKVTLILFNTQCMTIWNHIPLKQCGQLDSNTYRPDGGTALTDAMGIAIQDMKRILDQTPEDDRPGHVFFFVSTDGEENSSHRFTKDQIREMVQRATEEDRWVFTFAGANIDAFATGAAYGFQAHNIANIQAGGDDQHMVYAAVAQAQNCVRAPQMFSSRCCAMQMQERYECQRPQVKHFLSPPHPLNANIAMLAKNILPFTPLKDSHIQIKPVINQQMAISIAYAVLNAESQMWVMERHKGTSFTNGIKLKNLMHNALCLGSVDSSPCHAGSPVNAITESDFANIIWDAVPSGEYETYFLVLDEGLAMEVDGVNGLRIARLDKQKPEQKFIFSTYNEQQKQQDVVSNVKLVPTNQVMRSPEQLRIQPADRPDLSLSIAESNQNIQEQSQLWTKEPMMSSFQDGFGIKSVINSKIYLGCPENPSKNGSILKANEQDAFFVNVVWEARRAGEGGEIYLVLDEGLVLEADGAEVRIGRHAEGKRAQMFRMV